jgi:dienelactone hydrolase
MLPGQFQPFDYPLPTSAREWDANKADLRAKLRRLFGDLPPLFTPQPEMVKKEEKEGYTLEKLQFDNGAGHTIYGYLVTPAGRSQPGPAILYHHYHGGEYDNGKEEILHKWPVNTPPAEAFAKAGYVVLAIDAYGFGERQHQGPAGAKESGSSTESALFKMFIWQGKTLWGMMVRDDMLALNYLLSRTDLVVPERIGATGMSMGSTRTWWLAALDERIKAAVCVCCLTRYQNLIRRGEINQHGIYYFVPDLLREGVDMEAVVGLIAPRPLLTLTGDQDDGSPVDGVNRINQFAEQLYGLYNQGDHFHGKVYPGVAHKYTPDMWKETFAWFQRFLKEPK